MRWMWLALLLAPGCRGITVDVPPDRPDARRPADAGIAIDARVPDDAEAERDAGLPFDASVPSDSGLDAGVAADSGVPVAMDAGPAPDSGVDSGVDSGIDSGVDSGIPRPPVGFFFDDFESCDLSHREGGASWGASRSGGPDSVAVTRARARSGSCALQFTFGGGPSGDDAWAEQRFELGSPRTDFHVAFYIYFPNGTEPGENRYVHRSESPQNNKLLRVWADRYDGFKWGASMWSNSVGSAVSGETARSCSASIGQATPGYWFMTESDLGRWVHVELHVRGDDGSGNGRFELFVDGIPHVQHTLAVGGAPCAPNHFLRGYLLGWANSGFARTTNVYVDDVVFSTTRIGVHP